MSARPLICDICDQGVPANRVTPAGSHEGCGGTVRLLPPAAPTPTGLLAHAEKRIAELLAENARLRDALQKQGHGDLLKDGDRLDVLERLANKQHGLYLHDGDPRRRGFGIPGLGLRFLNRSLRKAIDQLGEGTTS